MNTDYLTESVYLELTHDNILIEGTNDYKMVYDDSKTYNQQQKIQIVAHCNKKTFNEFSFDEIESDCYPFLAKTIDVYNANKLTVTTTYSFSASAPTQT
jgi:hypothetical protein